MSLMATELANDGKELHIRQAAGLVLKNCLSAKARALPPTNPLRSSGPAAPRVLALRAPRGPPRALSRTTARRTRARSVVLCEPSLLTELSQHPRRCAARRHAFHLPPPAARRVGRDEAAAAGAAVASDGRQRQAADQKHRARHARQQRQGGAAHGRAGRLCNGNHRPAAQPVAGADPGAGHQRDPGTQRLRQAVLARGARLHLRRDRSGRAATAIQPHPYRSHPGDRHFREPPHSPPPKRPPEGSPGPRQAPPRPSRAAAAAAVTLASLLPASPELLLLLRPSPPGHAQGRGGRGDPARGDQRAAQRARVRQDQLRQRGGAKLHHADRLRDVHRRVKGAQVGGVRVHRASSRAVLRQARTVHAGAVHADAAGDREGDARPGGGRGRPAGHRVLVHHLRRGARADRGGARGGGARGRRAPLRRVPPSRPFTGPPDRRSKSSRRAPPRGRARTSCAARPPS